MTEGSDLMANCTIPEKFFIFTNRNRFGVPESTAGSKSFVSAAYAACRINESFAQKYRDGTVNYLPFQPQESDLPNVPEHILSVDTGFRLEYDGESIRREFYPFAPSRVSAIYAFGDEEACKHAHDYYSWDVRSVRRARLSADSYVRVWRVNMEIVSILREIYAASRSVGRYSDTWKSYWAGEGSRSIRLPKEITHSGRRTVSTGVIWQYLIEGKLDVVD
ncbi:MAG TPA: hypothetical protein VMW69_09950 [Spirochaetia bacterium]|nr:hypothetical protein [Spirochaetia bacterium]